jgi:ascorbate-specific PTS system EIIC-type component UlaA
MQARVKTNVKLEWSIAFSSLLVTLIWLFYPKMLDSATTEWFYTKTHYLLSVPLLGWVFRISGLFFVIGTILRFVSALFWIVKRPKKKIEPKEFDDFEEL